MAQKALLILALIVLAFSCSKQHANRQIDQSEREYSDKFYTALLSKDSNVIESAIHYIDGKITEGKIQIASIHYNKAQLLYRLKRYDDAIEEMEKDNSNYRDFYAATLLLRLDRESEAREKFNKVLKDYDEHLNRRNISKKEKGYLLRSKILVLHLLREDTSEAYSQLLKLHLLSESEMSMLADSIRADADAILIGMWPD